MHPIGIFFALVALISWGIGDFFIQRTSRDYGIWPSTFCITAFGAVVLFPFVINHIPAIFSSVKLWSLLVLGLGTLAAGLVTFGALKKGKIAVIEPIMSFELPLTILLAVVLVHENMTNLQMVLVFFVFGGILLLGYKNGMKAKHLLEKGAFLALLAALLQAGVNFVTGLSSQGIGPVETIWFVDTFVAVVCILYFTSTQTWHSLIAHVRKHTRESLAVAVFDNGAWVAYSAATVFIPISLVVTISESYIIITILLGVIINKEKLGKHQWIGVIITLVSVLILASISS